MNIDKDVQAFDFGDTLVTLTTRHYTNHKSKSVEILVKNSNEDYAQIARSSSKFNTENPISYAKNWLKSKISHRKVRIRDLLDELNANKRDLRIFELGLANIEEKSK